MRDKRTRGPGSRGPNDSEPSDQLDDRWQPWATGAANDNASAATPTPMNDVSCEFSEEATTLYQRDARLPAASQSAAPKKPARRPSARYRPPQPALANTEPRFGVEGSLPRSLRPGQLERGRSYGALLAGVLVIGLGALWTARGPAWSRAMLSISAYGSSVASSRVSLGHGHVVEPQPVAPLTAAGSMLPEAHVAPDVMEFDLADVPADARSKRTIEARAKRAQRAAAKHKRSAKKEVAKPIEPLVESDAVEDYQEPVYYRAAVNEGTLQVNSRPWARILIDGHFMGHTPQRALRLPAGLHRVLLVNEQLDMSKLFEVTIQPGQVVTRVEILDESAHTSR
jgi:hypothetical protein